MTTEKLVSVGDALDSSDAGYLRAELKGQRGIVAELREVVGSSAEPRLLVLVPAPCLGEARRLRDALLGEPDAAARSPAGSSDLGARAAAVAALATLMGLVLGKRLGSNPLLALPIGFLLGAGTYFLVRLRGPGPQARMARTTRAVSTPVSRWSRPWNGKTSRS